MDRVALPLLCAAVVPPGAAAHRHGEVCLDDASLVLGVEVLAEALEVGEGGFGESILRVEVGNGGWVVEVPEPTEVIGAIASVRGGGHWSEGGVGGFEVIGHRT